MFWSIKEAAYKCYTQKVEKRFFAPKKFECALISEDRGVVTFENQKFYTTTYFSIFYIHTVAEDILVKNTTEERIFIGIGASNFIDRNIKKRLQDETEILFSEIEKKKTNIGAPLFYTNYYLK